MIKKNWVSVFVFDAADGRSREERLKLAAAQYGGVPGELLQVARTERGKPYFPKCPEIFFSISHSGAFWVCAMAAEEVGVDIQEHTRRKAETIKEASARFGRMAHRFFSPVEARFVEEDSYSRFFCVWAARESYVKYTGQGIDDSFSKLSVIPESEELWARLSEGVGTVRWNAGGVWFCERLYQQDYTLCICTENECGYSVIDCRGIDE